jgi:magnesium-protoporphyrin O-methyltransferase
MHTLGRALPRGQRAPAIEPVAEQRLRQLLAAHPRLCDFEVGRSERIDSGFYISNAVELRRR